MSKFVILLMALLGGCVSGYMGQYIGQDIREVTMTEGQPVNAFLLDDGRMAYQYIFGTVVGSTTGSSVTQTTRQTPSGGTLESKAATTEQASAAYASRGCLVTYIARRRGQSWIVEDIRYPSRLVC